MISATSTGLQLSLELEACGRVLGRARDQVPSGTSVIAMLFGGKISGGFMPFGRLVVGVEE